MCFLKYKPPCWYANQCENHHIQTDSWENHIVTSDKTKELAIVGSTGEDLAVPCVDHALGKTWLFHVLISPGEDMAVPCVDHALGNRDISSTKTMEKIEQQRGVTLSQARYGCGLLILYIQVWGMCLCMYSCVCVYIPVFVYVFLCLCMYSCVCVCIPVFVYIPVLHSLWICNVSYVRWYRYSLVAKWAILSVRDFVVFTNFYDWFMFTGPSWTRISRVPDWHSWDKHFVSIKQNGSQMLSRSMHSDNNFLNISARLDSGVKPYVFNI